MNINATDRPRHKALVCGLRPALTTPDRAHDPVAERGAGRGHFRRLTVERPRAGRVGVGEGVAR